MGAFDFCQSADVSGNSNIDLLNYKLYDYVEKGELIGETINKNLILQFQKNGEYLDYKEII